MITKIEFFGAYLIKAKEEVKGDFPIDKMFSEIGRAWGVIEEMQGEGVPMVTAIIPNKNLVNIDGALLDEAPVNDGGITGRTFTDDEIKKLRKLVTF